MNSVLVRVAGAAPATSPFQAGVSTVDLHSVFIGAPERI
jgi:hypothetical protein